ncbi:hypothetical protein TIFTF001_008946 [Ficus carica]|uniref:Uncharacterized protein n=1 Tax=Ficus carica TaxID=3494 RepID=A0AA87ZTG1_FICCA|nr:hypothetical protein TIFTF001_008946 [Ficus carica]
MEVVLPRTFTVSLRSPEVRVLSSGWPGSYGSSSVLYLGQAPPLAADVLGSASWSGYSSGQPRAIHSVVGRSTRAVWSTLIRPLLAVLGGVVHCAFLDAHPRERDFQGLGRPGWLARPWLYRGQALGEQVLARSLCDGSPAKGKHLKVMGTPVGCLPWALPAGLGVRVTRSGRLPSASGGQIGLRCADAVCPISRHHVSMVWCQGTLGYVTVGTNGRSPCRSRRRKSAMGYVQ